MTIVPVGNLSADDLNRLGTNVAFAVRQERRQHAGRRMVLGADSVKAEIGYPTPKERRW